MVVLEFQDGISTVNPLWPEVPRKFLNLLVAL